MVLSLLIIQLAGFPLTGVGLGIGLAVHLGGCGALPQAARRRSHSTRPAAVQREKYAWGEGLESIVRMFGCPFFRLSWPNETTG